MNADCTLPVINQSTSKQYQASAELEKGGSAQIKVLANTVISPAGQETPRPLTPERLSADTRQVNHNERKELLIPDDHRTLYEDLETAKSDMDGWDAALQLSHHIRSYEKSLLESKPSDPPSWLLAKDYPPALVARLLLPIYSEDLAYKNVSWKELISSWGNLVNGKCSREHLQEIIFWFKHYPQLPPRNQEEEESLNTFLGERWASSRIEEAIEASLMTAQTNHKEITELYQIIMWGYFLSEQTIEEILRRHHKPDMTQFELKENELFSLIICFCSPKVLHALRDQIAANLQAQAQRLSSKDFYDIYRFGLMELSRLNNHIKTIKALSSFHYIPPLNIINFTLNALFFLPDEFRDQKPYIAFLYDRLPYETYWRLKESINLHHETSEREFIQSFRAVFLICGNLRRLLGSNILENMYEMTILEGPMTDEAYLHANAKKIRENFFSSYTDSQDNEVKRRMLHHTLIDFLTLLIQTEREHSDAAAVRLEFFDCTFFRELARVMSGISESSPEFRDIIFSYIDIARNCLDDRAMRNFISRAINDNTSALIQKIAVPRYLSANECHFLAGLNTCLEELERESKVKPHDYPECVLNFRFMNSDLVYLNIFGCYTNILKILIIQLAAKSRNEGIPANRTGFFRLLARIINDPNVKTKMEASFFEGSGAYEALMPLALDVLNNTLLNRWTPEDLSSCTTPGDRLLTLLRSIEKSQSIGKSAKIDLQHWMQKILEAPGGDAGFWTEAKASFQRMSNNEIWKARDMLLDLNKDSPPTLPELRRHDKNKRIPAKSKRKAAANAAASNRPAPRTDFFAKEWERFDQRIDLAQASETLEAMREEKRNEIRSGYGKVISNIEKIFKQDIYKSSEACLEMESTSKKHPTTSPESPEQRYLTNKFKLIKNFEEFLTSEMKSKKETLDREMKELLNRVSNLRNGESKSQLEKELKEIELIDGRKPVQEVVRQLNSLRQTHEKNLNALKGRRAFELKKAELLSEDLPVSETRQISNTLEKHIKKQDQLSHERKKALSQCDSTKEELEKIDDKFKTEHIRTETAFKKALASTIGAAVPESEERERRMLDYEKRKNLQNEAKIQALKAKLTLKKQKIRTLEAKLKQLEESSSPQESNEAPWWSTSDEFNNIKTAQDALIYALRSIPQTHEKFKSAQKILKQVDIEGDFFANETKLQKALRSAGLEVDHYTGSHGQWKGDDSNAKPYAIHDGIVKIEHKVTALNQMRMTVLAWQ